jgi:hypothetical protein
MGDAYRISLSKHRIITGLQQLAGRKMQPGRSANAQPLGGGIDAGENLCVEAQADRGNARVVVLQCGSGPHESWLARSRLASVQRRHLYSVPQSGAR